MSFCKAIKLPPDDKEYKNSLLEKILKASEEYYGWFYIGLTYQYYPLRYLLALVVWVLVLPISPLFVFGLAFCRWNKERKN